MSAATHDPVACDGRTSLTAPSAADLICGVDRVVVERFLVLVRDNYKKADEATFFLEQRSGVMNVPSMANMRDVLSHLVTLLNHDTPNERREEQLATSEEHLRRAELLADYAIALSTYLLPLLHSQKLRRNRNDADSTGSTTRGVAKRS